MNEDERQEANNKINASVQDGLYNPAITVYFRAGLLACREIMARFVEQGGDSATAQSIRLNWFPQLGPDPGSPRLFEWAEIADEKPDDRIEHKPINASVEALPYALAFVNERVDVWAGHEESVA